MKYYQCKINNEISLLDWFNKMHVSKNKINYLIDNKLCYINSQILNKSSILKKDDYLFIDLTNYHNIHKYELNKNFDILYEDEYIIVINKPHGMIIYSEEVNNTVTNMVNTYLSKNDEVGFPCHRLDKDTTGCLVFCKDIITLAYFSHIFETKEIVKEYKALVEGKTKLSENINYAIGSDRHINNKMVVTKSGKPALTKYYTEKYLNNKSLIKISLITGRTHQIRVHLAYIGHPLIGDSKYGSKVFANRTMLHCSNIVFHHPYNNKEINVKCNLPQDMCKLVK